MHPMLLAALLASSPASAPPMQVPVPQPSCVARHFAPMVGPSGEVPRSWAENKEVALAINGIPGERIREPGPASHGYYVWFHRPAADADHGYVVQSGGLAGNMRVYGPFPLPQCAPAGATNAA